MSRMKRMLDDQEEHQLDLFREEYDIELEDFTYRQANETLFPIYRHDDFCNDVDEWPEDYD